MRGRSWPRGPTTLHPPPLSSSKIFSLALLSGALPYSLQADPPRPSFRISAYELPQEVRVDVTFSSEVGGTDYRREP
ncbi:hypothetical protein M758_UG103400 [Ceratodon purpureus]|nr:hypothetical protein M758_UG103400 [Ceratodon purpureus]